MTQRELVLAAQAHIAHDHHPTQQRALGAVDRRHVHLDVALGARVHELQLTARIRMFSPAQHREQRVLDGAVVGGERESFT